ncbi:hypothetical protein BDW62DRAFT_190581 [Aspergillus aurantiobrunneus]
MFNPEYLPKMPAQHRASSSIGSPRFYRQYNEQNGLGSPSKPAANVHSRSASSTDGRTVDATVQPRTPSSPLHARHPTADALTVSQAQSVRSRPSLSLVLPSESQSVSSASSVSPSSSATKPPAISQSSQQKPSSPLPSIVTTFVDPPSSRPSSGNEQTRSRSLSVDTITAKPQQQPPPPPPPQQQPRKPTRETLHARNHTLDILTSASPPSSISDTDNRRQTIVATATNRPPSQRSTSDPITRKTQDPIPPVQDPLRSNPYTMSPTQSQAQTTPQSGTQRQTQSPDQTQPANNQKRTTTTKTAPPLPQPSSANKAPDWKPPVPPKHPLPDPEPASSRSSSPSTVRSTEFPHLSLNSPRPNLNLSTFQHSQPASQSSRANFYSASASTSTQTHTQNQPQGRSRSQSQTPVTPPAFPTPPAFSTATAGTPATGTTTTITTPNTNTNPSDPTPLLSLTTHIRTQTTHARHLFSQFSAYLPEIERQWIASTISDTEALIREVLLLTEGLRVDREVNNGKLGLKSQFRWLVRDSRKAREKRERLVLCHASLVAVLVRLEGVRPKVSEGVDTGSGVRDGSTRTSMTNGSGNCNGNNNDGRLSVSISDTSRRPDSPVWDLAVQLQDPGKEIVLDSDRDSADRASKTQPAAAAQSPVSPLQDGEAADAPTKLDNEMLEMLSWRWTQGRTQ